jgi:hypothetical protein
MTSTIRGGVDTQSGALVLIGSVEEFEQFADLLRRHVQRAVTLDPIVERAAIRPVRMLSLEPGEDLATIEVSADTARLSGDSGACERLADTIDLFLEHNDLSEPGIHAHVDAGDAQNGDPLLANGSRDLVLAGPIPDE